MKLDVRGSPYSEQAKFTERFHRPTFGRLEIDVTVDDPKSYTKPFTVRINQQILADTELIEFICNENQRSSDGASRSTDGRTPGLDERIG